MGPTFSLRKTFGIFPRDLAISAGRSQPDGAARANSGELVGEQSEQAAPPYKPPALPVDEVLAGFPRVPSTGAAGDSQVRCDILERRRLSLPAFPLLQPQPAMMLATVFAGRHADASPERAGEEVLLAKTSGPRHVGD